MKNSKGQRFFGLHFYPGVAEYAEGGKEPYRVFLNEKTLRDMDASFTGRPVFVRHVDGVDSDVDELRKEADGWVVRSFYNEADGKHWAEFLIVSEKGLQAIRSGMRLSNCYLPKGFGQGGLWNGVSYAREITSGEYEHLAIVPDPRYEESVILTPEEFKLYNENQLSELKRLANRKGDTPVKLNFFKRAKVENSVDLEDTCVVLPQSKREVSLAVLVNEFDQYEMDKKTTMANMEHLVEVGGKKMTVNELVTKHQAVCDALSGKDKELDEDSSGSSLVLDPEEGDEAEVEAHKKKTANAKDDADTESEPDAEAVAAEAEKKKNEADELATKRAAAKVKADKLRNARPTAENEEEARVDLGEDRVKRGKTRYGS